MDKIEAAQSAKGFRFAIVVSRYHDFVTDRLEQAARQALVSAGADADEISVVRVPGAFELPSAASLAAATGRFHAVVCLGCLVRGATPHFDFIASAVAQGLVSVSVGTGVPVTFGVLTTNSIEEALERAGDGPSNKGWEAAIAAVEMAEVAARLARRAPAS